MNLFCVLSIDAGLATLALGCVSLLKPLTLLGIPTRSVAGVVLALGLGLVALGALLPAAPIRLPAPKMGIDTLAPAYQFGELHEIEIQASAEATYRAIRAVTAGEIRFFGLLTWIRAPHLPGRGRESILNAPAEQPILEVALRSGFVLLADDPNREIALGMIVCCGSGARAHTAEEFAARSGPGFAKAVMNFHIDKRAAGGVHLSTQTRVFATDASASRRFAAYWRTIYPGSAFIRRMWLTAIKNRAEADGG